jgi:hypothetical protein
MKKPTRTRTRAPAPAEESIDDLLARSDELLARAEAQERELSLLQLDEIVTIGFWGICLLYLLGLWVYAGSFMEALVLAVVWVIPYGLVAGLVFCIVLGVLVRR